jgi:2-methylcitrate dehydratase PrpD
MLRCTAEERFRAFGAACAAASGTLKALDDGSELKPYNVAKASMLALTALQMGKAGFKCSSDPLGGRGFFLMMTGREDVALKPVMLNGTYAVMKSYIKPYASCRYTHPAVEGAIRLRSRVKPEEVESIQVITYDLAVSGHDHIRIPNSYSAKMSIPYAAAVGLIYGRAGLQEFTEEAVRDERILELTAKVHVSSDEALSAAFPGIQAAVVTIYTKDSVWRERIELPKGEPENPLTDAEFRTRFDGLMAYAGLDETVSESMFKAVYQEGTPVKTLVKDL